MIHSGQLHLIVTVATVVKVVFHLLFLMQLLPWEIKFMKETKSVFNSSTSKSYQILTHLWKNGAGNVCDHEYSFKYYYVKHLKVCIT